MMVYCLTLEEIVNQLTDKDKQALLSNAITMYNVTHKLITLQLAFIGRHTIHLTSLGEQVIKYLKSPKNVVTIEEED